MSTSWEAEHAPQVLRNLGEYVAADAPSSMHPRAGSARSDYTASLEASPICASDETSTGRSSSSQPSPQPSPQASPCPFSSAQGESFPHFSPDSERRKHEPTDPADTVDENARQDCKQGVAAPAAYAPGTCAPSALAGRVSVGDCSWIAGCAPKVRIVFNTVVRVNASLVQAACIRKRACLCESVRASVLQQHHCASQTVSSTVVLLL